MLKKSKRPNTLKQRRNRDSFWTPWSRDEDTRQTSGLTQSSIMAAGGCSRLKAGTGCVQSACNDDARSGGNICATMTNTNNNGEKVHIINFKDTDGAFPSIICTSNHIHCIPQHPDPILSNPITPCNSKPGPECCCGRCQSAARTSRTALPPLLTRSTCGGWWQGLLNLVSQFMTPRRQSHMPLGSASTAAQVQN